MGNQKYQKLYYIVLLVFAFGAIARGIIGVMGIEVSETVTRILEFGSLAGLAAFVLLYAKHSNP